MTRLPGSPADRRVLTSWLASAQTAAISDIGAYRSLQQWSDTVDMTAAVGKALDGSFNLSMEAQGNSSVSYPVPTVLQVPAGCCSLPFAADAMVYRYLPDALLRQRSASLNLDAAGTPQGGSRRRS